MRPPAGAPGPLRGQRGGRRRSPRGAAAAGLPRPDAATRRGGGGGRPGASRFPRKLAGGACGAHARRGSRLRPPCPAAAQRAGVGGGPPCGVRVRGRSGPALAAHRGRGRLRSCSCRGARPVCSAPPRARFRREMRAHRWPGPRPGSSRSAEQCVVVPARAQMCGGDGFASVQRPALWGLPLRTSSRVLRRESA